MRRQQPSVPHSARWMIIAAAASSLVMILLTITSQDHLTPPSSIAHRPRTVGNVRDEAASSSLAEENEEGFCSPRADLELSESLWGLARWLDVEIGVCGGALDGFEIRRAVQRFLKFRSSHSWAEIESYSAEQLLVVTGNVDVRFPTIPRRLEDEIIAAEQLSRSSPAMKKVALPDPVAAVTDKLRRKARSFFKALVPLSVLNSLTTAQLTELLAWSVGHGFDFDAPDRKNDRSALVVQHTFLSVVAGEE